MGDPCALSTAAPIGLRVACFKAVMVQSAYDCCPRLCCNDLKAHDQGEEAGKGKKKGKPVQQGKKGAKRPQRDEEFGVTRGIDFKGVRTIVNFDPPSSVQG